MSVRVRFRHLDGQDRDRLDEVRLPALIGSAAEADVRAERAAAHHARVFEREGEILLQVVEAGLVLRLSGEDVREAVLREGDVIELGEGGPRLRLEAGDDAGEEMLEAAPWEREGSLASTRALVARSFAQISPPVRRLLGVGLGLALAALGYSQLQDRKLRHEVERLREALSESERGSRTSERSRRRIGRRSPPGSTSCASARRRSTRRSGRPPWRRRGRCATSSRPRACASRRSRPSARRASASCATTARACA
jgi:hypothetical protein